MKRGQSVEKEMRTFRNINKMGCKEMGCKEIESVTEYLKKRGVKLIAVLDQFEKGGELLYFTEDCLILKRDGAIYIFTEGFEKFSEAKKNEILSLVSEKAGELKEEKCDFIMLGIYEEESVKAFEEKFGYPEKSEMYCLMMEETQELTDKPNENVEVRKVPMEDWKIVFDTYTHSDSPEATKKRIEEGEIIGVYSGSSLMGFAGTHSEGSMGMLEVLKDFRGKGLGRILINALIRSQREKGRYAYGYVEKPNINAIEIYRKMNFTMDNDITTWLFIDL